jgi:hypothetical protein
MKRLPATLSLARRAGGYAAMIGEKLKFLSPQQLTGYFRILSTALRAAAPHFRFNKVLIFFLFEFIPRCKQRGIQISFALFV